MGPDEYSVGGLVDPRVDDERVIQPDAHTVVDLGQDRVQAVEPRHDHPLPARGERAAQRLGGGRAGPVEQHRGVDTFEYRFALSDAPSK